MEILVFAYRQFTTISGPSRLIYIGLSHYFLVNGSSGQKPSLERSALDRRIYKAPRSAGGVHRPPLSQELNIKCCVKRTEVHD